MGFAGKERPQKNLEDPLGVEEEKPDTKPDIEALIPPVFVSELTPAPALPIKRGRGRPKDTPEIKELKRQQAFAKQVAKETLGTLAAAYGIHAPDTSKQLSEAQRKGILDAAADVIATRLLPKSIAVWEQALDGGNVDVASRVIEGMAILAYIQSWKKPAEPGDEASLEVEFERYRATLTRKLDTFTPAVSVEAESVAPRESSPGEPSRAEGMEPKDGEVVATADPLDSSGGNA
jgi:hypothetical protein